MESNGKSTAITSTNAAKNRVAEILKSASKPGTMLGIKQKDIGELLTDYKSQIAAALPKHLTADRVIQMAATLISRNPKIAECTTASLIGAVMQASILGFRPVEALGECYFVPYKNKVKNADGSERYEMQVQFQIGYKGYLNLARRSGELQTVFAYVVRQGDEFSYELGLHPTLRHKPAESGTDDAPITHVYAVTHYKDGGYNFVVLTRAQVERYRMRSQSQRAEPSRAWDTDYDAMAMKTALRRLSKYLPISIDYMEQAIATDGAVLKPTDFATDGTGEIVTAEYAEVVSEQPTLPAVPEEPANEPSRMTPEEIAEYQKQRELISKETSKGEQSWLQ
ncbi:MAG: recombinase RecT [Candidatus Kapabacteria bacterium]|nr:recombinase RecT [Candidatus Kapabacteria bacterium]